MSRAESAERKRPEGREAQRSASRPTPLAIVSSAVAGDGLERIAASASDALGQPVAIVLPSLGQPVVWPANAVPPDMLEGLVAHVASGVAGDAPPGVEHAVPIRIGNDVVGVVAAIGPAASGARSSPAPADEPGWLEATAAAAAVTRVMRDSESLEDRESWRSVVEELASGPPADAGALVEHGRRLGVDLAAGAVAVCGRTAGPFLEAPPTEALGVAELAPGCVVGVVPLSGGSEREAVALAEQLRGEGWEVGVSAPRRQPELLHEAVREAMLLAELMLVPEAAAAGQEETYRLLIGVLLRDPAELEQLRAHTIAPLLAYDAEHATELLTTLGTFLVHHGSTTETAEAMQLHRHTVGYRLSRVQEVSGLSPYESDGRERLSLGLKAAQILAARERLSQPG